MISEAQFSLTTGTAVMNGASYDGTAEVPTASGANVKMLKFSMSSLDPDRLAHADRLAGRAVG